MVINKKDFFITFFILWTFVITGSVLKVVSEQGSDIVKFVVYFIVVSSIIVATSLFAGLQEKK